MAAQSSSPEEIIYVLTEKIMSLVRESGATGRQIIAALECARAIVPATELMSEQHYSH